MFGPGGVTVFPYSLGVTTVVQGLYSLLWIAVLMDVLSPTLDLRDLPEWSTSQGLLFACAVGTLTFALGVVMHTLSRNLFRKKKDLWAMDIVLSPSVRQRLGDLGASRPAAGPSLDEVHAAEGFERVRKAGEFMHALDYALMVRAPHVHSSIQVYRDQYRLARGFVLPSVILAFVLPFWDPVPAGHVGNFPLISFQLFFMAVLFAGISMYAFRERSYRYAAARVRSYLTLEVEAQQARRGGGAHLSAVS